MNEKKINKLVFVLAYMGIGITIIYALYVVFFVGEKI